MAVGFGSALLQINQSHILSASTCCLSPPALPTSVCFSSHLSLQWIFFLLSFPPQVNPILSYLFLLLCRRCRASSSHGMWFTAGDSAPYTVAFCFNFLTPPSPPPPPPLLELTISSHLHFSSPWFPLFPSFISLPDKMYRMHLISRVDTVSKKHEATMQGSSPTRLRLWLWRMLECEVWTGDEIRHKEGTDAGVMTVVK